MEKIKSITQELVIIILMVIMLYLTVLMMLFGFDYEKDFVKMTKRLSKL